LGVNSIQLTHAHGEVPIRGFNDEMKVVIHKAIGMAEPMVAFVDFVENEEKVLTILVILVNRLLFISPGGDMIHSARIFDA